MVIFHLVEVYLRITETFIYNYICKSSENSKHKVYIISFSSENRPLFPLPDNVEVIFLDKDVRRKRTLLDKITRKIDTTPKWYDDFKTLLLKHKPGVVHCHFGTMGVLMNDFVTTTSVKQKYVVSFYGADAGRLPELIPGYKEDLIKMWATCNAVFCEGPFLKTTLVKLGADTEKVFVNPIIIDTTKYPRRPFSKWSGVVKFLVIGRFIEKKGIHLFLTAIGKIKNNGFKDFEITLIGDGDLKSKYLDIIEEYHLNENVIFKGLLPLEQCKEFLLSHDALVHPSMEAQNKDTEGGAPTIILESQIVGLPVITSDHADIPNVLGYTQFMCKENDIESLVVAIENFINSSSEELQALEIAGRDFVIKNHSFSNSKYIELLGNVINE
ncbi:glycosyltransferase [Ferruginibacter lapsinanis]|uniref:glycosyltransferase n=1 Tax=Ferruginibacter lapsinanis TaxID=563172 RepID=UPI001E3D1D82|nr:glycosyltransferase [Ferruginibacter lapsinanis]UEG49471.1 glycosyltransferase [Ferruginibacter lapsinanis]